MTIIDRPTLGRTYELYGDASGIGMSFQNLKRNLNVYTNDVIELYKYHNQIIEQYPDHHANHRTHKELYNSNINTNPVGNKVNGTTVDEANAAFNNTTQNIQFIIDELLNISTNIDKDFQKVTTNTVSLNNKINDLEEKIKPYKKNIEKLKSGVATSEGMLHDAQLIYNERLTSTCLLGVLTVGSIVAIYKNWRSMKT